MAGKPFFGGGGRLFDGITASGLNSGRMAYAGT
jgi:hypothetical protein